MDWSIHHSLPSTSKVLISQMYVFSLYSPLSPVFYFDAIIIVEKHSKKLNGAIKSENMISALLSTLMFLLQDLK